MSRRLRSMNAPYANPLSSPTRPRLVPGVPVGGVLAALLAAGSLVWLLVGGGSGHTGKTLRIGLVVDDGEPTITPPVPPTPPAPPVAPDMLKAQAMTARIQAEMARVQAAMDATGHANIHGKSGDGGDESTITGTARALTLSNVRGDTVIHVDPAAQGISLHAARGTLRSAVNDGVLQITGVTGDGDVLVTLPPGTALTVNGASGDLVVDGALDADVRLDMRQGDVRLGDVRNLDVQIAQSGDLSVGTVSGKLSLRSLGSGDVRVGTVGSAELMLNGSGNASLGSVTQGLRATLAGSGDVQVGEAAGNVDVDLFGAGTVTVAKGSAHLKATTTGGGDITFNGTAIDPILASHGSGTIHVAHIKGTPHVTKTGSGDISLGD